MRLMAMTGAALVMATACASAPHGHRDATPLTSVDTAYYEVPGATRAEWAAVLPRASRAAGIMNGAPSLTMAHLQETVSGTRTTAIGCQVDRYEVQLRLGHVMPRLSARSAPSAADRAAWDAFMARLWERAQTRESVAARIADSLRTEVRAAQAPDCPTLVARARKTLALFPARYGAAVRAAEEGLGGFGGAEVP